MRKIKAPKKHEIFWDMRIPTQFYEEDFIEFEKYMEMTGLQKLSTPQEPHASSEFCLRNFELFEKFR